MTRVTVTYETGRVWVCDVDAVGGGDEGEVCAAAGTVELREGALVFEPSVLPWGGGAWRSPKGIVDEWTNSRPGFIDRLGEQHTMKGGMAFSQRGKVEEAYAPSYVLLTSAQLAGAVSVTVDGALAYSAEGGGLVPTAGGCWESPAGQADGLAAFASLRASGAEGGAVERAAGIRFHPEVM